MSLHHYALNGRESSRGRRYYGLLPQTT